jgi:glycerol-3-phosphate dehydrogenase
MTQLTIRPGDPLSMLNRGRRERDRNRLTAGASVDVLVIGGGVTGVGVALDAATRGLSVALVEAHDFAFGTSRWSSKMVHGGLRYLAKGDLGVAWESATERAVIGKTIAPYLVHPFAQLIPIFDTTESKNSVTARIGMHAGDVLRRASRLPSASLPRPTRISAVEALELVPALPHEGLVGADIGWDFQLEDDARFVVAIARTAAAYGASMLTATRAASIDAGGADVVDETDGLRYRINAQHVINATGVWAGTLDPSVELTPSRGTHVIVRSERLGNPSASLTIPVPGSFGRFIFAVPQFNGLVYIGLTDVAADGPLPDIPEPDDDEVDWILDIISLGLATPLTREDVVGTYSGLRPLARAPRSDRQSTEAATPDHDTTPDTESDKNTADISRRHLITGGPGEVITITGGKLTTYRRMAQDVVDLISDRPCVTTFTPLVGVGPTPPDPNVPARLVRRFGSEAALVASLADEDAALLEPISNAVPTDVLGVEILWAQLAEGALSYDDIVSRRTRISLVPADERALRSTIESLVKEQISDLPLRVDP